MEISSKKLSVPVILMEYAIAHKMTKALTIYLFLKMHSSGQENEKSKLFKELRRLPNLKDKRTIDTHLQTLRNIGWVGYNPKSGVYFIRTTKSVVSKYSSKKRHAAATCYPHDLLKGDSFFAGAIISKHINAQKYTRQKEKWKRAAVTNKRDVTFQPNASTLNSTDQYYGLSNGVLAEIFKCGVTRASQLKNKAAKDGYIKTAHRYRSILLLQQMDFNVRSMLLDFPKEKNNRLKIIPEKINKSQEKIGDCKWIPRRFELVEQLYDEITPLVPIKTIKGLNGLKKAG